MLISARMVGIMGMIIEPCVPVRPVLFIAVILLRCDVLFAQQKPIDFVHDIAPIIKSRCGECHTNGTYKGSLSLDTRDSLLAADVVVVGKGVESDLIRRVTSEDAEERMPPKGPRLTKIQIDR